MRSGSSSTISPPTFGSTAADRCAEGRRLVSLALLSSLLGLPGCGLMNSQSVYEGVRSNEKARAVVTDKSRSELPPYEQYQKERTQTQK